MSDLNTQEQENANVNVSSEAGSNVETSSNNNSSVEIDRLKEKVDQTNKHLEDLIKYRQVENAKPDLKPEEIAKSIMEDSIVDPDKASKNLADFVTSQTEKAKKEAMMQMQVEQEANSAVSAVIAKNAKLAPLMEDVKFKAARMIRLTPSLTISEAIKKAAEEYEKIIGVPEPKKSEEKTEEEVITDGNTGSTVSTKTVKQTNKEPLTLEQEIAQREDQRLAKANL